MAGYIYEYLTAKDKQIMASSSMMTVNEKYTTFIGTKGDFIPTSDGRNCEVYRNSDGQYVGGEIRETKDDAVYNTLWYRLADIYGIKNIKKIDKANGLNEKTIFINNGVDSIHTKIMGLHFGKKTASRRFDIEFKKCILLHTTRKNKNMNILQ